MIEMSAAEFRQVIDVDLNAPFIVAKAVIPGMIKKGHGKIINICSMMSELGRETVSAYAAAKGGLKMLTRNIASEYGEYNIQCNGIGPGYTRAYKYQSLAAGFMNRTADPFIVTVEPKGDDEPIHYNHHNGQEFNLVLEGRMLINIEGKEIILNQGDSIYFNSKLPHGMKALDGKTVRFLAVIM